MSHANGNGLAHRYHLLEPHERFRAALEAGARDDDDERRRLVDTCPMRRARITDPAYVDRIEASRDLAVAVALHIAPRLAQLRLLEATRELVGPALAMGAEPEPGDESPLLRAFSDAAAELRSEAAGVYEAFALVCRREIGLEPEVLLAAHLGPALDVDGLAAAKADKATVREWRQAFERSWRQRVGAKDRTSRRPR